MVCTCIVVCFKVFFKIINEFDFMQGLRTELDSVKGELLKTQDCYPLEFQFLGRYGFDNSVFNFSLVLFLLPKLYLLQAQS